MPVLPRRPLLAAVAALGVAGALPRRAAAQQPPPAARRVRGTIAAVGPDTLTVTTRGGEAVAIGITDRTPVVVVAPATLAAIRQGAYIGTAARRGPDGALHALEVHVFSDAMRGVGEGHRPWEGDDTTMTNATVGQVTGTDGRTLRLTYKGGEQTVVVGPDTPVVAMDRGTHALLVKGAHVAVSAAEQGGGLQARFVSVGKDGFEPPL